MEIKILARITRRVKAEERKSGSVNERAGRIKNHPAVITSEAGRVILAKAEKPVVNTETRARIIAQMMITEIKENQNILRREHRLMISTGSKAPLLM